jgi:1-pyrroline-4-hydroxy-2-carboxylate deaminase
LIIMNVNWHGVFPAITTQFRDDQSLDIEATGRHMEALIAAGIHGVVLLGSVGENTTLEYDEKIAFVREMRSVVDGRIPVLSGVAEYTTALGARYARNVEKIGIDGLMVLPGMVYKSDERETITHFRTIAKSTGLPIMIYNNPVSYGVDVTPEAFGLLADVPNIVAIKESSEKVHRVTDLVNLFGDRFVLFAGVDDLVLESMMLGVKGWISGLVNAFPDENRALWDLASAGKWAEAQALYRWYTPLLHLDTKPKLVQYIKLAMAEVGLGSEMVRAPKLPLVGAEREAILKIIRHAIATRPAMAAAR